MKKVYNINGYTQGEIRGYTIIIRRWFLRMKENPKIAEDKELLDLLIYNLDRIRTLSEGYE